MLSELCLTSFKGGYIGGYRDYYGGIKEDTKSLDYGLYRVEQKSTHVSPYLNKSHP